MSQHRSTAPVTTPTASVYTSAQRKLHWWVVVLLVVQWLASQGMVAAMQLQAEQQAPGAGVFFLSSLHLFSGLTVFCLVVVRIGLRWMPESRARRQASAVTPRWAGHVATLIQALLYGVLLLMPLSGALAYFLSSELAIAAHGYLSRGLLALVLLHVLGALFHRLIRKDGIWERMVRISL